MICTAFSIRGLLLIILLTVVPCGEVLSLQSGSAQQVLDHAKEIYRTQGPRSALPEYQQALALSASPKIVTGKPFSLGLIGNCYKRFGEFPKALEYLNQALSMKEALGDQLEQAKTQSHLGLLFWRWASTL